jgi:hypothetical protein
MGLSTGLRSLGCFKDPESRAARKQKKAKSQVQSAGERPNRPKRIPIVVSQNAEGNTIPMRNISPRGPTDTSQPQAQLAPTLLATNPISRSTSQPEPLPSQSTTDRRWAVDENGRREKELQGAMLRESADREIGYMPPETWSEGTGIRASEFFGLPRIQEKPKLTAEEEEEMARRTEEDNSRRPSYVPRAATMPANPGITYGWTGKYASRGGPTWAQPEEPYYNYSTSPTGTSYDVSYKFAGHGAYGNKRRSEFSFLAHPAN